MQVKMYRNYDKFPYQSENYGDFNGRMIFTFFRPISRSFDCILVELPEGYAPQPLEKYEHSDGWQLQLDQVIREENGMDDIRGLTIRFFDEKWKDVKEDVNRRSVTTFETLKERIELKSNWHEKTYIGNPGDYVLNIDEKRYLILGVIAAEDTSPSSDHTFFHVQSFNSKDQETRLPAFGLPENTPPAIIEMIEKEAARRDELISRHGEEDWG